MKLEEIVTKLKDNVNMALGLVDFILRYRAAIGQLKCAARNWK